MTLSLGLGLTVAPVAHSAQFDAHHYDLKDRKQAQWAAEEKTAVAR